VNNFDPVCDSLLLRCAHVLKNLSRRLLLVLLVLNQNVIVGVSLVDGLDVDFTMVLDALLDLLVLGLGALLELRHYHIRVLTEHGLHEESLGERKGLDFVGSDVAEFRLEVEQDVVVAEEVVSAELVGQRVTLFLDRLLQVGVPDAYVTCHDEVHLLHFIPFVVDDGELLLAQELARLQPKRHVLQQLRFLVSLRLEK